MKYRFILTYQATDSETTDTRTCFPLHGDDLSISIDRAEGEWYYTRNLDGKLVFERDDYEWIMGCEFDGTFTLNIKESHDNGSNWYDYFTGTFSRASLEIDQDNHQATLNGLKEGVEDLIKNGKNEDYDLMKLIPDSEAKEVQGQVPPALAMVDYRSISINKSDVFCGGAATGNGYKSDEETGWEDHSAGSENGPWYALGAYLKVATDSKWGFVKVLCEAKVEMQDGYTELNGIYAGELQYSTWNVQYDVVPSYTSVNGTLRKNGSTDRLELIFMGGYGGTMELQCQPIHNNVSQGVWTMYRVAASIFSPSTVVLTYNSSYNYHYKKVTFYFHYIRATLLTQSADGVQKNVLDTGDYYKGMATFQGSGLTVTITANTSEQPNGHRMVPGSDEYGGTPQYFAPPDDTADWIPLAEDNWNYASMWYTIEPSVPNGLDDPAKFGTFRWTRCWTIGCCIKYLLKRITNDKVVFSESTDYSQFLYGNPNPVEGHEPFQWLVTQKSNVMHPAAGGASRCPVRLDWFLELLRNAFNCYYWFERRSDGRYDFRIEHVEYFRRGGAYSGQLADQLDLTRLKPYRNFLRNGQPAKRYADQTNRYTFDLDGMVEKYTYSWQGDGGGDDFKGNPMYFKAGWIEKGSSEDHQVDNIFADLGWLMLNAGTETASSKNYDGLFIFGGYQAAVPSLWKENTPSLEQTLTMTVNTVGRDLWLTAPSGYTITITNGGSQQMKLGTGKPMRIALESSIHTYTINFGADYANVVIHRLHARSGNVFRVPNVTNMLRTENTLQNGVLAWPWLQVEYLHYDIPATKWTYLKDDYTDNQTIVWKETGTIKMVKKQTLAVVPVPDASTEDAIVDIMGVKTGLGTGIIDNAKINLSSRNAEMTIIYDINPNNN